MKTPARNLTNMRERWRERSAARERYRRLEREISVYSSASDRSELDAILARHTPDQTREIDSILSRQAVRQSRDFTRPPR